jgi:hypothetical protein
MTREDALQMKWQYEGPIPVNFIGTTAAIIGGAIAAGGSIGAAAIGASGAKSAAETQAEAARETQKLYEPFREAGTGAVGQLSDLLAPEGELMQGWDKSFTGVTADELQLDPGYQFRLDEGQKAIERSAAARGGLTTGGTIKATERYAQGLASDEYQKAYNRKLLEYSTAYNEFQTDQENTYRRLMGLTNVGLAGAGGAGRAITEAGAATASGQVGSANAWSGGVSGATSSIADLVLLNSLLGSSGNRPTPTTMQSMTG